MVNIRTYIYEHFNIVNSYICVLSVLAIIHIYVFYSVFRIGAPATTGQLNKTAQFFSTTNFTPNHKTNMKNLTKAKFFLKDTIKQPGGQAFFHHRHEGADISNTDDLRRPVRHENL